MRFGGLVEEQHRMSVPRAVHLKEQLKLSHLRTSYFKILVVNTKHVAEIALPVPLFGAPSVQGCPQVGAPSVLRCKRLESESKQIFQR